MKFSYLKSSNADYIDDLFARYSEDPDSVDDSWRYFFEGLELGSSEAAVPNGHANGHAAVATAGVAPVIPITPSVDLLSEAKVVELILAYRSLGRVIADINPLTPPPSSHPELAPETYGLTQADLGRSFQAGKLLGLGAATLKDIIALLRATYCGKVAIEISHISDRTEREWLQKRLESARGPGAAKEALDPETRKLILKRLTESETFERFLHTRYVAQKRFSVEGGENTIPMLDAMIETGTDLGSKEFVIGMAHRGRLNVLRNIFGKKAEDILVEFEGTYKIDPSHGEGDVKYHKGYSSDITTRRGKQAHLSLGWNPSHLEFINPVIEGSARAKQDLLQDSERTKVIPIAIHGDASFAGQGVCYETLNMSQLRGYATGGTLHIIINNQVGFTTSPVDSRSTTYCTDMAKMLEAPIFHVNGDDADAAWFIAKLCTEFRQKFKKDAFIDLICYRKHGHNEGDEPSFTQPLLYKQIKTHPSPREAYAATLARDGLMSEQQAQELVDQVIAGMTEAQSSVRAAPPTPHVSVFENRWKGLKQPTREELFAPVKTAVDEAMLKRVAEKINHIPQGFHLHPKLARFFEARLKAVHEGRGIDWGNGEALAYATLLIDGHPVRLSGQDAERGTFTHRHSVLNDFETGETYYPFNHVEEGQAQYQVYNSNLSETAVMGFEYGYSLAAPNTLTIWEAQFGDFANGAQVIIDQFLSSAESKWQRMSGLTLLLPHGYEGQGPEHSSARLERYLQLCGRDNMYVCNLTTPAQIFHALRRQVVRDFRKPLVVMSPKSLLRHPQAISSIDEFTKRGFQDVLDDAEMAAKAKGVKRVLLCSGKVYYDLHAERTARKRDDVAIVRVEQLYPFPADLLAKVLGQYAGAELVWVQEEPRNMGAWSFIFSQWMGGLGDFAAQLGKRAIRYVGRDEGAAPAVGSPKLHEKQQKALLEQAFS